jgi:DNA-binding transcriptional LysR family regulator
MARARAMDSAAQTFAHPASAAAETVAGAVRVSCSRVYGIEILPPLLQGPLQRHPGLEIKVVPTNSVSNLPRRDADIAIRRSPPRQEALIARKVAPIRVGRFAAPSIARHVAGFDFPKLAATGLMIGQDDDETLAAGLCQLGLARPTHSVLRSDDDLAQLAAIRAGIGFGICQVVIGKGSGRVRLLPDITPTCLAWVVMHEDQRRLAHTRTTYDALVEGWT